MSKIFAIDMDGTLLTSKDVMHPSTIKILKKTKEQGHTNVIATGRPFQDIHHFVKDYKCFSYYVCNNGTYIYDVKNKKKIFDQTIPIKMLNICLKKAQKHSVIFIAHTNVATYRTIMLNEIIDFNHPEWKEAKNFKFIPLKKILEKLQHEKITQLSFKSTKDVIKKIYNAFKKYTNKVNITIAGETYFDINPKNTSKFTSLKKLVKITGHSLQDIIAFGDSGNDVEMLKMSKHGFCMENGLENAKKVADEVIGNNNTNAIALKIEQFL